MSVEIVVAILGVCGVVIAAVLRWKPGNGTYVSKEVCAVQINSINRRLDEVNRLLSLVMTKLDKVLEAK